MTLDIGALLDLWTRPHPGLAEAAESFRELYADPVLVNGASLTAEDLARRASSLQAAFTDVHREVIDVCDAGSKVALAFRLEGVQVGPLATSAGVFAPTGKHISLRVIDVITMAGGKITSITMVADELGALAPVRAAALVT